MEVMFSLYRRKTILECKEGEVECRLDQVDDRILYMVRIEQ